METLWNVILHVTDGISLLIIVPGFMFILVVNILDWKKNKKLDVSDQLICGIGLSSLSHRILQVSFRCIVVVHGLQIFTSLEWLVIDITFLSQIFCTVLFSTLLAVHFCLKIVKINQSLYIHIQRMFPKMFPWIFLPSVLTSLLLSGPAAKKMSLLYSNSTNVFQDPNHSTLKSFLSLKLYVVSSSFCFLIFAFSVAVTVVSLYRHIHRVQNNAVSLRAETLEAHVTAVKTLIALLAYNLLYFILVIFTKEDYGRLQWMHVLLLFYAIFHVFCFLILVRGSTKLQKEFHAMWLRCLSSRKTPD